MGPCPGDCDGPLYQVTSQGMLTDLLKNSTCRSFISAKAHRLSPSLVYRSPCTSGGLQAAIITGQAADGKLALARRNLAGFLCPQVPDGFTAVMSADTWEERGPNKFFFRMSQPIPSYLIALAIGDLVSAEVGPR